MQDYNTMIIKKKNTKELINYGIWILEMFLKSLNLIIDQIFHLDQPLVLMKNLLQLDIDYKCISLS